MNSSKILRKVKYQHNHSNMSNFQFLLGSMQRDKERQNKQNHQDNAVKSNGFGGATINFHPPVRPFFEGKQNKQNPTDSQLQTVIYKIKKYLSATDDMLYFPERVTERNKKQAISISKQLIDFISNYEKKKEKQIKSSMLMSTQAPSVIQLGSNKTLSSSYHFPNGLVQPQYIKKISHLEGQKEHLQSLISQHERANIKMYIKLNEGESQQIEAYKKQLSSLFQKYKQLEKVIQEQSKAVIKLKIELQERNKQIKELEYSNKKYISHQKHSSELRKGQNKSEQIRKLRQKVSQMQDIINEQNEELNKAIKKVEDFMNRQEQYKSRQKQYQSIINRQNSEKQANKRINSCIQSKNFHQQDSEKPKDEDLYRMVFSQASLLDDLLGQ